MFSRYRPQQEAFELGSPQAPNDEDAPFIHDPRRSPYPPSSSRTSASRGLRGVVADSAFASGPCSAPALTLLFGIIVGIALTLAITSIDRRLAHGEYVPVSDRQVQFSLASPAAASPTPCPPCPASEVLSCPPALPCPPPPAVLPCPPPPALSCPPPPPALPCPAAPPCPPANSASEPVDAGNCRVSRALLDWNGAAILEAKPDPSLHDDLVEFSRGDAPADGSPTSRSGIQAAGHQTCRGFAERAGEAAVMVTSMGRRFFEQQMNKKIPFELSIWQSPPPLPLWIVHENTWDAYHGRPLISRSQLPHQACLFDGFELAPWLWDMQSMDPKKSALEPWYEHAGAYEPYEVLTIKSGKTLIRKLVAIYFTLMSVADDTLVIWIDGDISFRKPPDEVLYAFARDHDLSYIPFQTQLDVHEKHSWDLKSIDSPYWRIESGVMLIRANTATRDFFKSVINMYRKGYLLDLSNQCRGHARRQIKLGKNGFTPPVAPPDSICRNEWVTRNLYADDIYVISLLLHAEARNIALPPYTRSTQFSHPLRQGWLPAGCVNKKCDPKVCERVPQDAKQYHTIYTTCSEYNSKLIAPFNIFEYFFHNIGSGANSMQKKSQHSPTVTLDKEIIMPK